MIPSVKDQVDLLKDLYLVLENLETNIQETITKNKLSVKNISIDYDKELLRILVNTEDNRSIIQIFRR